MTLHDLREWLGVLAEADASLPARVVLERLPVATDGAGEDVVAALTVEQAGELLGRSSSTVRSYCRGNLLPGSYRQRGREWRVPRSAIAAFQSREHEAARAAAKTVTGSSSPDLATWRRELDA